MEERKTQMSVIQAIRTRRSIARMKPDPIPREIIEECLDAAVWAPNHRLTAWNWQAEPKDLDQMLWPVVKSAADLLTSDELDRVKECADDRGCGELFLDMSKNRSRKWCSMEGCGNRAKVRQYYIRKKSSVEEEQ